MLVHKLRIWWQQLTHAIKRPWITPLDQPDVIAYVDSRDCGLVDAVQRGWYLSDSNELLRGFQISSEDSVLDVGCGAGGATLFFANRRAKVAFTDLVAEKIDALRVKVAFTPAPVYYFERPNHIHVFEREEFAGLVRDAFGFFWTFWMFLYWAQANAVGTELKDEPHDVVQPPYPPLLNDWARLWGESSTCQSQPL